MRTMKLPTLLLLALAVALCVLAPGGAAARAPPQPVAVANLSATGCPPSQPAQLLCGPGSAVQIASVSYGRTIAAMPGLAVSCPAGVTNNVTGCVLAPADQAAATLLAAQSCDGKQSCSLDGADIARLFADPCPGISKILFAEYACLVAAVQPVKTPTAPPAGDLYARYPAASAAPRCPSFAAAVSDASADAVQWQVLAQGQQPGLAVSVTLVDSDLSKLDGILKTATGGAVGLDNVAFLNLTAVNVLVPPDTTIVIGKSNPGFTTVSIRALNIIGSPSSTIDVHSAGPDASGRFGPDVSISASNIFGALQVRQNGLTALHPKVATASMGGVTFTLFDSTDRAEYLTACGQAAAPNNGNPLITPPPCSTAGGPTDTEFAPLCVTANPECTAYIYGHNSQNVLVKEACLSWKATVQVSSYYGAALLGGSQKDGNPLNLQDDRIVYPGYAPPSNTVNAPTFPAKGGVYGTSITSAGRFLAADGAPGSAAAQATWNSGSNPQGVFSTADYTISLDAHPASNYESAQVAAQQTVPADYSGLLGLQGGWAQSPPAPWVTDQWTAAIKSACPAQNIFGITVNLPAYLNGTVTRVPAAASGSSYSGPDPLVLRLAGDCLDEIAMDRRFAEAKAFAADVVRSLPAQGAQAKGPAAYASRILGTLRSLRNDASSPLTRDVPFLSAGLLSAYEADGLRELVAAEQNLDKWVAQKGSLAEAANGLQAGADQIAYAVTVASGVLEADKANLEDAMKLADRYNESFNEAIEFMTEAKEAFDEGLQAWKREEIAFSIIEIIGALVTAVVTDGIGGVALFAELKEMGNTVSEVGSLVKTIEIISRVIELVKTIVEMIKNEEFDNTRLVQVTTQSAFSVSTEAVEQARNNSDSVVSLSVGALAFQNLHDQATTFIQPAINANVEGATNYSYSLQKLANTGIAHLNAQIQLINAQGQVITDVVNLQAAAASAANIDTLLSRTQGAESGFPQAYFDARMSLIEGKLRALEAFHKIMHAYSFAYTGDHLMEKLGLLPSLSDSADTLNAALLGALTHIGTIFDESSCFCNASWIIPDTQFAGNLSSSNGTAWMDLTDVLNPNMYNFFGGFDNVHIYQLNLKPYGIRLANANGVQNPTLHLEIIPVGSFVNTFSHSGVWYQREYNAKPLAFNPVIEPLNDWSVITPGSLAGYSQALVYMPTPYTRFLVRPRTDAMVAEWDWSGVWGAQIEMWGSFRPTSSLSAGVAAGKMGSCTCPSPSSFKGTGS